MQLVSRAMSSSLDRLVATMTVQQLADVAGTTVEEVVQAVVRGSKRGLVGFAPTAPAVAKGTSRSGGPGGGKDVDTRSAGGRTAYDDALLGVLKDSGEPMSAEDLRTAVGGTPLQARSRLKALVKKRKVKSSGRARATKYQAR